MIDLGDPLHSGDTCFVRAPLADVFAALCDPTGYPAYWRSTQTSDHKVSHDDAGRVNLAVGDSWRLRALIGAAGLDCEVVATDLRRREASSSLWMDWRGQLDPVVGLGTLAPQRSVEAESEWFVRDWRGASVVTAFWRVRAEPRRRQERFLLTLRQLSWGAMTGLKSELERA